MRLNASSKNHDFMHNPIHLPLTGQSVDSFRDSFVYSLSLMFIVYVYLRVKEAGCILEIEF